MRAREPRFAHLSPALQEARSERAEGTSTGESEEVDGVGLSVVRVQRPQVVLLDARPGHLADPFQVRLGHLERGRGHMGFIFAQ